jgi:hypothetical protein
MNLVDAGDSQAALDLIKEGGQVAKNHAAVIKSRAA